MPTSQLNQLRKIFSVSLCCLLLLTFSAQSKTRDTPPFYQITYQGHQAYLLGSIHIGRDDFYPLPQPIAQAFERSRALVVEADTRGVNVPQLLQKYGTKQFPISDEAQEILAKYCKDKQALCAARQAYSPWLQSMQISIDRYTELGFSALKGVDHVLVSKVGKRPIYQLENTEFQFQLLASFDAKTQWEMVTEAITASDEDLVQLIKMWRVGNEAGLADLMEGSMIRKGSLKLVKAMLWDRNKHMAANIIKLMQETGTQQPLFIVVGAGHLVGQQSVQFYLEKLGGISNNCWKSNCK